LADPDQATRGLELRKLPAFVRPMILQKTVIRTGYGVRIRYKAHYRRLYKAGGVRTGKLAVIQSLKRNIWSN
jgi:hypothetical protein